MINYDDDDDDNDDNDSVDRSVYDDKYDNWYGVPANTEDSYDDAEVIIAVYYEKCR